MKTATYDLPNGFSAGGTRYEKLTLRRMSGRDEDFLRDKKEAKKDGFIHDLVTRCIVALGDETDPEKIKTLYKNNFLMADFTFALVQLRRISVGDIYRFRIECPHCQHHNQYSTDLGELVINQQKKEHQGSDRFDRVVKDGDEELAFTFRHMFVKDYKLHQMIAETYGAERGTRELMVQLLSLGGDEPHVDAIRDLPLIIRNEIRHEMDEVIGGIDLRLDIECSSSKCERRSVIQLPVTGADFFFQTGRKSEDRTASPYRESGASSPSWPQDGDGNPPKH